MKGYEHLPFMSTDKEKQKEDLICFKRTNLWMRGSMEQHGYAGNGGELVAVVVILIGVLCYFVFR